jgi:hypothetical protein
MRVSASLSKLSFRSMFQAPTVTVYQQNLGD